MDRRRQSASVWTPRGPDGEPASLGSAFWVGEKMLLTADHAVPRTHVRVRFFDEDALDAKVVERDLNRDVALLELVSAVPGPVPQTLAWLERPTERLICVALGYPRFHRDESKSDRLVTEDFLGELAPYTAQELDQLHVTNKNPPPSDQADSWRGMSGAGLVAKDALLGIVTEARHERLIATPIASLREGPLWTQLQYLVASARPGRPKPAPTKQATIDRSKQPEDVRYDAFLSFNGEDRPVVELLAKQMRSRGLRPWFDEWSLRAGSPTQEQLEAGVRSSALIVVCVGSSGFGPWQTREMRLAISDFVEKGRPVIPVALPGTTADVFRSLPGFLGQFHGLDFRAGFDDERTWTKLTAAIEGRDPDDGDSSPSERVARTASHGSPSERAPSVETRDPPSGDATAQGEALPAVQGVALLQRRALADTGSQAAHSRAEVERVSAELREDVVARLASAKHLRTRKVLADELRIARFEDAKAVAAKTVDRFFQLGVDKTLVTISVVHEKAGDAELAESLIDVAAYVLPLFPDFRRIATDVRNASSDSLCYEVPGTMLAFAEVVVATIGRRRPHFKLDGEELTGKSAVALPPRLGIDADLSFCRDSMKDFYDHQFGGDLARTPNPEKRRKLIAQRIRIEAEKRSRPGGLGPRYLVVRPEEDDQEALRADILAQSLRADEFAVDVVRMRDTDAGTEQIEVAINDYLIDLVKSFAAPTGRRASAESSRQSAILLP